MAATPTRLEELQIRADQARSAIAEAAWKFKLANDRRFDGYPEILTFNETMWLSTLRSSIIEFDAAVARLEGYKRHQRRISR